MRTKLLLAALFTCAPMIADAQVVGQVFGTQEGCSRLAGNQARGDGAVTLSATEVAGHESRCPISSTEALTPNKTRLVTTCSGEGETWEEIYITEATGDPKVLLLARQDSPDSKTTLTLCE